MRNATKLLGPLAALTLVGVVVTGGAARAQSAPSGEQTSRIFAIKAGLQGRTTLEGDHFTYDVKPDTEVADSLVLINYRDEPTEVRVYPADMKAADGGGLAPAQDADERRAVGKWLGLEEGTLSLDPKQELRVPFTIHVPKLTIPGEYLGAVVASASTGTNERGLAIETRAALLVRVRVPGKVHLSLDVGRPKHDISKGDHRFSVDVRNTGNVLVSPKGYVELRGGGRRIGRFTLQPKDIYVIPNGKATYQAVWTDPPAFGRFQAVAHVTAEVDGTPARTFTSPTLALTILPVRTAAAAGALLLLAGAGAFITRKRRRRWLAERREIRREVATIKEQRKAQHESCGHPTDFSDAGTR